MGREPALGAPDPDGVLVDALVALLRQRLANKVPADAKNVHGTAIGTVQQGGWREVSVNRAKKVRATVQDKLKARDLTSKWKVKGRGVEGPTKKSRKATVTVRFAQPVRVEVEVPVDTVTTTAWATATETATERFTATAASASALGASSPRRTTPVRPSPTATTFSGLSDDQHPSFGSRPRLGSAPEVSVISAAERDCSVVRGCGRTTRKRWRTPLCRPSAERGIPIPEQPARGCSENRSGITDGAPKRL